MSSGVVLFWILLGGLLLVALALVAWPLLSPRTAGSLRRWPLALGVLVAVGAGTAALYGNYGTPGMITAGMDRPDVDPEAMALIRKLEKLMAERPNDPKGWLLLARAYTRLGQVDKAVDAYRRVVKLDPDNRRAAAALGGMLVAASGGQVPAEAMSLFQKMVDAGNPNPMARFYLGLGHMQNGNNTQAFDVWSALAKTTPPGAPWIPMLEKNLTRLADQLGRPVPDLPEAGSGGTGQ